ncbi:hypothetical protein COU54_01355 [Candidatus Pacearchaeota archaeon CG10_big_fil_rev_8_21_14_0_10_31_24]|nr:MAG: hypothetical protein COU54_01355 [Candidatus Pacearchaeota archaeon CG10_big_fil_rev_8_21_14_0_10_31_24]
MNKSIQIQIIKLCLKIDSFDDRFKKNTLLEHIHALKDYELQEMVNMQYVTITSVFEVICQNPHTFDIALYILKTYPNIDVNHYVGICNPFLTILSCRDEISIELMKEFIKKGVDVNHHSKYNYTPLLRAIQCGNLNSVKILVDAGANILQKDTKGKTPLDLAKKFLSKNLSDLNYNLILQYLEDNQQVNTKSALKI